MRKTEYLYDCDPVWWVDLPYKLALETKVQFAEKHMRKIRLQAEEHLNINPEIYETLVDRYLEVEKAKIFNQVLLEELTVDILVS